MLMTICCEEVYILYRKMLVVVSMETGQEVNADKSMYMVMSQDQNAGRSHRLLTVPLKGWKSSNI